MSTTVKAQKAANETNLQIAQETNATNQAIADAQNELNYKMFNEQNDWNLKRRDEEWAYNDPSAQMERYMRAGINPLWAMQSGDAGKAQQLTSATPSPAAGYTAVGATVAPEYDSQLGDRIGAILGAANNVMNGSQGFMKLALDAQDVDIRRSAQQTLAGLQAAEIAFKKSQTQGQDIFNRLNTDTYQTLVDTKVQEYQNLVKQGELTDLEKANAMETKKQIIAMTDYTNKQSDALIEQVRQGWRKLAIDQQNANTSQFAAQSTSYYQGQDIKLRASEFQFNKESFEIDMKSKTNDQLIKFYNEKRGYLGNILGNLDFTDMLSHGFSSNPTTEKMIEKSFNEIQSIGNILHDRVKSDPSFENVQTYQEYLDGLKSLPQAPKLPIPPAGNAQGFSIMNPSQSWQ